MDGERIRARKARFNGVIAMKTTCSFIAAASPEPLSAAAAGPDYCQTVPTDPAGIERWNDLCLPDEGG
jgi:hypothetical protein